MIPYLKASKDLTKTLLELKKKFINGAGCKINIQKPVVFLYSNNELLREKSGK
jgi:hypothetical protein